MFPVILHMEQTQAELAILTYAFHLGGSSHLDLSRLHIPSVYVRGISQVDETTIGRN